MAYSHPCALPQELATAFPHRWTFGIQTKLCTLKTYAVAQPRYFFYINIWLLNWSKSPTHVILRSTLQILTPNLKHNFRDNMKGDTCKSQEPNLYVQWTLFTHIENVHSYWFHKKFGTDPRTTIEIMVLLTMQKEKVEKWDPESTEMVVMGRWSRWPVSLWYRNNDMSN